MRRKVRKLNFLIEEDVCQELENLVPAGKRSGVVNEALRKELELIRRQKAVQRLLDKSRGGEKFSTLEIVESLAEDRSSH